MKRLILLLAALLALCPALARAHALDPAYLELTAMGDDRWRVIWRVPDVVGQPMALTPRLPEGCSYVPPPPVFDGRGWSTTFEALCPAGLAGGVVRIEGLERTGTDTLLRYELEPGDGQGLRLTPGAPEVALPDNPGPLGVLGAYVSLGVVHILEGADHLMFVLALLLLIRDPRRLLWTITAFTLAHSITLAAATMGWLRLPPTPVEVVIALSIVFLAWELALPPDRRDPLAMRYPALVSFGFGLIHGLGFAGALRDIGLPRGDIPLALFSFNVGVELGQVMFIAACLAFGYLARRLVPVLAAHGPALSRVASYGIGSLAAFWVIQRLSGF